MSGGSYEYLCWKSAEELHAYQSTIQRMGDRLTELGYDDFAMLTEDLLLEIRLSWKRIEARRKRLEPIWHAVEWLDSADWGLEEVEKAVQKERLK